MIDSIDFDQEFRSAIGRRLARGVVAPALDAHLDNRLPAKVAGDPKAFAALLDAALDWAAAADRRAGALGIWRGLKAPSNDLLIEVVALPRDVAAEDPDPALERLAAAAHRLGGQVDTSVPLPGQRRVAIRFVLGPPASARTVGDGWGGAFRGKRMLVVRSVLLDATRCTESLASIGAHAEFLSDATAAQARLARVTSERPAFDFTVIDTAALGPTPERTARTLARAPGTGQMFLVGLGAAGVALAAGHGVMGSENIAPWRRILDMLLEHILHRPEVPVVPKPTSSPPEIPDLRGYRILIAEDVATNQSMLRAILGPTGATLDLAETGSDALALYTQNPADLVLMDIQMPEMDGIAAARRIREHDPSARIVALTAYARKRDREIYTRIGMQDHLAKPIRVEDLYAILRRHLSESAGPRAGRSRRRPMPPGGR